LKGGSSTAAPRDAEELRDELQLAVERPWVEQLRMWTLLQEWERVGPRAGLLLAPP
jgi:hypothetical protein